MLVLHDVTKTYTTKAKTETHALKGVNLEIANRGMVFILGKSGSGKSTLLNLLGGLDSPSSGEILINGKGMAQFTPADYDAYRNEYVGFIFQEFNLLNDFNVRDNVSLALRLAKAEDVDKTVSDALKQVELNDTYLTRRIGEMSGGEKQRIAIARAIIKDSKIILADEPTGNLDSATGTSIWNILKTLSKERLVVVVSHDRESAEKYADRIIEIADGQVVADNGTQPAVTEESQEKPAATKNGLSFATKLKMGYNNLRLRKAKTVSTILVAVFCILSVLITQMCLSYTPESAAVQYIRKTKLDYFAVGQGYIDVEHDDNFTNSAKRIEVATRRFIDKNCHSITDGVIESKQNLLDFGFTFVGEALELDDNSYYATTDFIEETCYDGGVVEVDGEYVDIIKELHPIEFLVGKKLNYSKTVLAGVIDLKNVANTLAIPRIFCNKNFNTGDWYKTVVNFNINKDPDVALDLGGIWRERQLFVKALSNNEMRSDEAIVTADGLFDKNRNLQLADNEIVLSYELFAKLFDAEAKRKYLSDSYDEVLITPTQIGQKFNLKFYECKTSELIADFGEVKLVGVYFKKHLTEVDNKGEMYTMFADSNLNRAIYRVLEPQSVLVQTKSVRGLSRFVNTLRRQHLGYVQNIGVTESDNSGYVDLAAMVYDFDNVISFVFTLFLAVGGVLAIVFVLLVINLISFSIASRKKEIGILSAIGTSNKDITSIFLLETAIIAAICFVLILALSFAAAFAFNVIWSSMERINITFPFVHVSVLTVTIMIAAAFGLPLLAALIPIRKIIKLKPIDAIREV